MLAITRHDFINAYRPSKQGKMTDARRAAHERQKTEFTRTCEKHGMNPHTVRKRMRPPEQGGQGMTLEEALAAPVLTPRQAGQRRYKRINKG